MTESRFRVHDLPTVCVLIPAYNEAGSIASVVNECLVYINEVVVVDDGSSDETADLAEKAGAKVFRHDVNMGKGSALQTGFEYIRSENYEAVITMDGDGQHEPSEIPRFIRAYQRTGIPVLVGNRSWATECMPYVRRLTNRFMTMLLNRMMNQYVPDTQCGYRLYRCDILPYVTASARGFAMESEILLHVAARGFRIDSVRVASIYAGEKSRIRPIADTIRFIRMLMQFEHNRRLHFSSKKRADASV